MIKAGQIYREKELPKWRRNESRVFAITNLSLNKLYVVYIDGKTDYVGVDWLKEDCELIAEYQTWQQAVNSKEFKG